MDNTRTDKTFNFNPPIDNQYLIELYAGDYSMIGETLSEVLLVYDDFVENVCSGFERGDLLSLKGAVHKLKPLFGFVGLPCLEAQCRTFESNCMLADSKTLAIEFNQLKDSILSIKSFLETEKARLEAFNKR
ncbi:MAG TPA: Hpt domain-containing protein [Puia sp.]|nr:Hpt domain-containing protein [Puia sp.]